MSSKRSAIQQASRIVVKVGSSLLASLQGGINTAFLQQLVEALAKAQASGKEMVLVSSGAVAAGCAELGLEKRPSLLPQLQAAAAVGQCALMRLYRKYFLKHEITAAQVLLTRDDLECRERFLHARNTLRELIKYRTIPVINENDTVAVAELKLKMGDNDGLAVAVAQLIDADAVIILSDVPGLYDRPPQDKGAALISHVDTLSREHFQSAGGSVSGVGTGGMSTKLGAALGAMMGAIPLVVAAGNRINVISEILDGEETGTYFAPHEKRTSSRQQWIAFGRLPSGSVIVDDGAKNAIIKNHTSLLPIGVTGIEGNFHEGDTVNICDISGEQIARGLVNFSSEEVSKIAGQKSTDLEKILGCECCETVIHKDNMVVLGI